MSDEKRDKRVLEEVTTGEYKYGFVTDIESEQAPKGLTEDTVRFISKKKTSRNGYWNSG